MSDDSFWRRRQVLSWAAYDWANSAFSLTVVTAFFPVLLSTYWNDGAASTVTTYRLGMANGVASLVVALLVPLLGARGDAAGQRKSMLVACAGLGIAMTASLNWVAAGHWQIAVACFVVASVAYAAANSLYDSLLIDVARPRDYDQVSALGYALGYIGGAALFGLNVLMVNRPQSFGLSSPDEALRWSFVAVAVWWFIFSLPLARWVTERSGSAGESSAGWAGLLATARRILRERTVAWFLLAYWLYIDGVYTIIKMAVDYGMSQGLSMQDLIQAILLTNIIGFPAALLFGWLGRKIGAKVGIQIALVVYIVTTIAATFVSTATQFYVLAAAIGVVQGGVQSLSRSLFAQLIPTHRSGEYFGFFNMVGRFSAIIGPMLAGFVALTLGSQRLGILSILVLFVAGFGVLSALRLPAESPARPA